MKLFRLWTRQELVDAIRDIEEGLATGAQSVSYNSGGTITYTIRSEALKTLEQLYARLNEIDGVKTSPRARQVRIIALRG